MHRLLKYLCLGVLTLTLIGLVSPAWAQVCGAPGKDGVSFSRNSYFPGSGTAGAGSSVVNFGAARIDANAVSTAFGAGDLALVIQMQDALVNNADSGAYGDGVAGDPATGSTNLRSTGFYEFRRVVAASGGSITLDTPLVNTYTTANADTTSGNRRFQVVRVPQFASVTLPGGILNVTPWNGSTGGLMVIDASGLLNLNSTTINANAVGFRGGGSQNATVISGSNVTTYASAQVAGTPPANLGAAKGEGIAGTPRFVRSDTVISNGYSGINLGTSGYANGFDLARGAAGNAGGGGTQHNAGGGGGGNAGTGGRGGNTYANFSGTNTGSCVQFGPGFFACGGDGARAMGGFGGLGVTPTAARLFLGGGGGAGESNNANDNPTVAQGSGGNGGGLIFVRARSVSGSGVFNANGGIGQPGGRDAAGGGGAGGTVVLITESTSVPGLQVNVSGGAGGNTGLPLRGNETQGTGAGGGGGAFIRSTGVTVGATQIAGGASGVNVPVNGVSNTFGASGGAGGVANVNFSGTQFPNPTSCFPQLTVLKSTTTPTRTVPTDSTAGYVVSVRNAVGVGVAVGVAVTDVLPAPFTLQSSTATVALGAGSLGPSPAPATGTSTVTIATPGSSTATSFFIPPGGEVTLTFNVSLNGAAPGTYQNPADTLYSDPTRSVAAGVVTPGGGYANGGGTAGGSNYASGASIQEDVSITASTLLTITKTNAVGTVTAGTTTSYTITVANGGPSAAANAVLRDPAATGLNCTAVSCSVSGGAAVCPVAPALSLANLQSPVGVTISSFPANSSLSFVVTCGVTATGVP
ncbi:hypothetical protein [Hydrogenophaga sp.]|uniref:hypothetical protein n=1 Tax=Hydrogenophaga sp. TaxID=1904254 RepID=UPI0025C4167B|nr:hypothetical protein [Hydrogenophaga sp.]